MQKSMRTTVLLLTLVVVVTLAILVTVRFWSNPAIPPAAGLIQAASPLIEPVTRDVFADRGWQNTEISLASGETIHFQFMSGEIRDGEAIIRGLSGAGWACGESDCCEPMPDVERDALIGRVGDHIFSIGDTSAVTVSAAGELQLRINDCDAGLFDNSGSLQVNISP